jgi:hypothetical protein
MKLGFTGTRNGMTAKQKDSVITYLTGIQDVLNEVHHGDCIGADTEFHHLIRTMFKPAAVRVIGHPPINSGHAAGNSFDYSYTPRPYLSRNKQIVDEVNKLLACPKGHSQYMRSGTWSTVRYARKIGRPIVLVFPDGMIKTEQMK